jgi:Tfp pilus assembly protein PilO
MRYIFLLALIGLSIGAFVIYIKPRYQEARDMQTQISAFSGNLDTAEKLKTSREELIAHYNSIPKSDLDNLKTLLPDSVDNIRLIIQMDLLATRNGLSTVRGVSYQPEKTAAGQTGGAQAPVTPQKPYGEFVISFETSGQYQNFLSFLSDLEENLRLVDVTKVDFTSTTGVLGLAGNMTYRVTLKTYWLRQ